MSRYNTYIYLYNQYPIREGKTIVSKKSALIIAVEEYQDSGITAVKYAENDASEIVPFYASIDGYNLFSFIRASLVVNRQFTFASAVLRITCQAATSSFNCSIWLISVNCGDYLFLREKGPCRKEDGVR